MMEEETESFTSDHDNNQYWNLEDDGIRFSPFRASPVQFFNEHLQAGSVKGAVFTLVISIVGAGTLSVPYAISQSGLILGAFMFIIGSFLAAFTLQLLTYASEVTAQKSYESIARKLYGKTLSHFIIATLLLNLYGTAISYLVAASRLFTFVMENAARISLKPGVVVVMLAATVIFPLSTLRTMTALRYSSLFGVICILYLAFAVVAKYFQYCSHHTWVHYQHQEGPAHEVVCFYQASEHEKADFVLADWQLSKILQTTPIVVYAYTCHPSLLPILLELNRPNLRRMRKVIVRANLFALTVYLILGSFVYMTFLDQLKSSNGNFLFNDYHNDPTILVGAAAMAISLTLAVPLFVSAFRNICAPFLVDYKISQDRKLPFMKHVLTAFLFLTFAAIPAVVVKDISDVFTILGATTNPLLCFVFPAMFIMKIEHAEIKFQKIAATVIAFVMPIISIAALVVQVLHWKK